MDDATISVTLAARRFSDCVNRVRYQGASFILEKNGVPVARLIPVQQNLGSDLEQLSTKSGQSRPTFFSTPEIAESPVRPSANEREAMQNQESSKVPKRPILNW